VSLCSAILPFFPDPVKGLSGDDLTAAGRAADLSFINPWDERENTDQSLGFLSTFDTLIKVFIIDKSEPPRLCDATAFLYLEYKETQDRHVDDLRVQTLNPPNGLIVMRLTESLRCYW